MNSINTFKEIFISFIFTFIYALKYKTFNLKIFLVVALIYVLRIIIDKYNIVKIDFIKENKWMHLLFAIFSVLLLNMYWGLASTMILINILVLIEFMILANE
ncbi:MAG: hypothetical protein N2594_08040 [Clostridiales bacterium]|nr:hypothetical protein [Clostridiales bacterium]